MALDVDPQLTALAESIVPALPDPSNDAQAAARVVAVTTTKDLCQKIMAYVVSNMEINGVKTQSISGQDANTRANAIITAGVPVPTDGGAALKTTMLAAAIPGTDNSTQSNDGKGLIL